MKRSQTDSDVDRAACLSKLTWASREEAVAARAYANWQYGDGAARPRPYRCRSCGKWHLARSSNDS